MYDGRGHGVDVERGGEVFVDTVNYYNQSPSASMIKVMRFRKHHGEKTRITIGDFSLEWFNFMFEEMR